MDCSLDLERREPSASGAGGLGPGADFRKRRHKSCLRQGFGGFFVLASVGVQGTKKMTKPQPPATSRRALHGSGWMRGGGECANHGLSRQKSCHEPLRREQQGL